MRKEDLYDDRTKNHFNSISCLWEQDKGQNFLCYCQRIFKKILHIFFHYKKDVDYIAFYKLCTIMHLTINILQNILFI